MIDSKKLTPLEGVRYFLPPDDALLVARDGKIQIPYGDLPIPLLEADYDSINGDLPSYDAVGRGIYQILRFNPECYFGERYAKLLQEAYPHYLAEMASHIIMLDSKDVEVPYLDRKINYLKVLLLIEPGNHRLFLEIAVTYMDKGTRISALHLATTSIYKAKDFLLKALHHAPDDLQVLQQYGEASYLLGHYEDAASSWQRLVASLSGVDADRLMERLQRLEGGGVPRVPVVDYLEAAAVAFSLFQQGEYEESAAIICDILEDIVFRSEYPIPELHLLLGQCYEHLAMPKYAEDAFHEALTINPEFEEARSALNRLGAER